MATCHHRQQSVLITGGNQGIGYHTALQLCAKGYHVTIACRNIEKAKNACASIVKRLGSNSSIDFIIIDLSQLSSVSKSVRMIISQKRCYDIIILNAAVLLPKVSKTKDGFDAAFQISPRRDRLQQMFSISSSTSGWFSYARSKLAIAMLACYLDRIEGIQAISVHPGAVSTSLSNNISPRVRKFLKTLQVSRFLSRVEDGARNVVECVEGNHFPNTFRNSTKYSDVPKRISDEQNEINLMIISKEMITGAIPDFCPNPIFYSLN